MIKRLHRRWWTRLSGRYDLSDVGLVSQVTARQWRTAADRSPNYLASYWDKADEVGHQSRATRRSEWFASLPPFAEASSALELGCGAGRNLYMLQQRFPTMLLAGLDINAVAIAYAKTKVRGVFGVDDLYPWSPTRVPRALPGSRSLGDWVMDIIFTMGVLIHLHPAVLPNVIQEMAAHTRRSLIFCEQISEHDEVVKGPAWWRPSRRVTGNYIQWSPNLPRILGQLGLKHTVSDVPTEFQGNGARHLVVVTP